MKISFQSSENVSLTLKVDRHCGSKNNNAHRVFFKPFQKQRLNDDLFIVGDLELEPKQLILLKTNIFFTNHAL